MIRTWRVFLALLFALLGASGLKPVAGRAAEIKRPILALFDSTIERTPRLTRIHRHAEIVLNHLGYIVEYADVAKGMPDQDVTRFAGIMTWFSRPLPEVVREDYARWITGAMRAGTRAIILDEIGGDMWGAQRRRFNTVLELIGLRHTGRGVTLTAGTQLERVDREMFEFERRLDPAPPSFPLIEQVADPVDIVLEVRAPAYENAATSILAAIGPRGGYVAPGYALTYEPYTGRLGWLINPFRFFDEALKRPIAPVPDVTTVSGRRIYFSHVDGLGLHNVRKRRREQTGRLLVDILNDDLVAAFPDMPVTIGLIAGDIDPDGNGNSTVRAATQRLLALPNVEVGVHTYSHPFRWEEIQEEARLELAESPKRKWSLSSLRRTLLETIGLMSQGELDAQGQPLRLHHSKPFNANVEVGEALTIVNGLAPESKKARLYQWSGNNSPSSAFVSAVQAAGLTNINGGDSRYDADYPSIAYLAPLTAPGNGAKQVYAPISGGSMTFSYWRPPLDALTMLGQSLDNTATPRLKPISLHYGLAWLDDPIQSNRIRHYLKELRRRSITPISASRYGAIVDGFHRVVIEEVIPGRKWIIRDRGAVQTLRLDDVANMLDLTSSTGVVGYHREGASLYITLDSAVSNPTVTLAPPNEPASAPNIPRLVESRWSVSRLWKARCSMGYAAEGFGDGQFVWAGMEARTYDITVRSSAGEIWRGEATSDDTGELVVTLPVNAITPVTVLVRCRSPQRNGQSQ